MLLRPTQAGLDNAISQAMTSARDVIDRRINALGTREPTIVRQGDNRILVEVPGLQDPEQLKALIGRTARLEFKLVDLTVTPRADAAGRAPIGSQILPYAEGGPGAAHRRPAPGDHQRRHDLKRHAKASIRRTASRPSISVSTATAPAVSRG